MTRLTENLGQLMGQMTAADLAAVTGVPGPTISAILQGDFADTSDESLEPLARHFGVTSDVLKRGALMSGTSAPRVSATANLT